MNNQSDGERGPSTHGAGVTLFKSDVALLSPGGTPGVLDGPGGLGAAHHEDGVVDVGLAVVENARSVGFPVAGVDSHGHGSSLDDLLDFGTTGNFSDTGNSVVA